jgi:hypothetical protein
MASPRRLVTLAIISSSWSAAGVQADNPACTLAEATLGRFKTETTYGWHAQGANFTNVGQSSSLTALVEFYNATKRPGVLELQGVFFGADPNATHNGKKMRGNFLLKDASERWAALLPKIKPLIEKKILVGFMLGDELVWNNVSWVDLNATAAMVKRDCPEPWLFYNEGGAPLCECAAVLYLRHAHSLSFVAAPAVRCNGCLTAIRRVARQGVTTTSTTCAQSIRRSPSPW